MAGPFELLIQSSMFKFGAVLSCRSFGMEVAEVYAPLDDREAAFRSLQKAYDEHDPKLMFLGANRRFESLKSIHGLRICLAASGLRIAAREPSL